MATQAESLQGPRLAYVVREIKGTIERMKMTPPPSKFAKDKDPELVNDDSNVARLVKEPAGFMVYLPSGHCYRMSQKELLRRGFHKPPTILSLDQANDTQTAAGRFKLAITEGERKKAYAEMEAEVIKNCVKQVGNHLPGIVSAYDPNGKLEKEAA